MFNIVKKEIEWGGKTLSLETGKIARQADGAVLVTYGETQILCTAVGQKEAKEGVDFFPLTVNYQEKTYAAGKIPGGFFKREGRPSEKETLVSRLIDRPLRPMFPEGFHNEVQVLCTVISHDLENDPDIPALVGAAAALSISGIPLTEPVAGARVALVDGKCVLNPTTAELEDSDLDLVVAGTESSVLMVESQAHLLSEKQMLDAVIFGHEQMQPVIQLIKDLKDEAGKEVWTVEKPDYSEQQKFVEGLAAKQLREAYAIQEKQSRSERLAEIRDEVLKTAEEKQGEEFDSNLINKLVKTLEKDIVRGDILETGKRIDGRDVKTVRPIVSEIGLLHKAHGSALFTRGETQALVTTTLGTSQDQQLVDALEGSSKESFMLHYNFPPFSVGEVGFLRGPGRREIGHGKLAWKAVQPVLPSEDVFPYTLRVVSEITESNGSSSMATVCGTSMALMDAGVPIQASVAGIAMGLIKEGDKFQVLSDILGDEDHLGDMDFKVAGTKDGVTALQMDIKINGITTEIMEIALAQAKEGREHILGKMAETVTESRGSIKDHAPQITSIVIDKEKIGNIIGPGGKTIKEICEVSTAKVDIEEDGTVRIAAVDGPSIQKAKEMIQELVEEPEVGKVYEGPVTRLLDFGVLVRFMGKNEGMVHISEISNERVEQITDYVNESDVVKVVITGIDRGKFRLSMKRVDQESGEITEPIDTANERRGGGRGDSDRRPSNRPPRGRGGKGGDPRRGGGNRDNRDGDNIGNTAPENDDSPKKKRRFF